MAERGNIIDQLAEALRDEADSKPGLAPVAAETWQAFQTDLQQAPPPRPMAVPPPPLVRRPEPPVAAAPVPAGPPPSAVDISAMGLDAMRQVVASCRLCRLCEGRTNTVFADGTPQAELMFVGEGPGEDEDRQGLPFVGKAGQLLTKMITAMGFERREVYIANIVKCRPPGNRTPEPDEAGTCLPYVLRQIELVKPKAIVLLGAVPLQYLMNMSGISKARGKWLDFHGIPAMPTFHPAYLLRNEAAKRPVWEDLQQVMQFFGKTYVPPRRK